MRTALTVGCLSLFLFGRSVADSGRQSALFKRTRFSMGRLDPTVDQPSVKIDTTYRLLVYGSRELYGLREVVEFSDGLTVATTTKESAKDSSHDVDRSWEIPGYSSAGSLCWLDQLSIPTGDSGPKHRDVVFGIAESSGLIVVHAVSNSVNSEAIIQRSWFIRSDGTHERIETTLTFPDSEQHFLFKSVEQRID